MSLERLLAEPGEGCRRGLRPLAGGEAASDTTSSNGLWMRRQTRVPAWSRRRTAVGVRSAAPAPPSWRASRSAAGAASPALLQSRRSSPLRPSLSRRSSGARERLRKKRSPQEGWRPESRPRRPSSLPLSRRLLSSSSSRRRRSLSSLRRTSAGWPLSRTAASPSTTPRRMSNLFWKRGDGESLVKSSCRSRCTSTL